MFRDRKRIHQIYFVIDILLLIFSFYLPYKLNPSSLPSGPFGSRIYFSVFVFWGTTLLFLLNNSNLYVTDRYLGIVQESWLVTKCVLFSSVLAALFIFVAKIPAFSRLIFIESGLLLIFSLSSWRAVKRIYVRQVVRQGRYNYNVLIVGAGKIGLALSEAIENSPNLGIRIIGFLDDIKESAINGFKILGKIKDLEDAVKRNFVDEIYVTIPSEKKVVSEVILKGAKLGKSVRLVAEHFDLPYRQIELNYIGYIPLITYSERHIHRSEYFFKRFLDITIAGLVLISVSPVFAIIASLIKIDNSGPVFYIGKRCGKKGKIFNFYKFRSMVDGADNYKEALRQKSEVDGPIFKIKKDPRITKFGAFLRKYSFDELPQLINVLKGDMSIVGPRPFPVEESERIENKYISRLDIKPGITGLAQIRGRSDLSFRHWARWDIWYINNWSLGLDLKILWMTIPAVLKSKGAY